MCRLSGRKGLGLQCMSFRPGSGSGPPNFGGPWPYLTTAVKSLKLDIPSAATSPARTVTWTGLLCGTASLSRTVCAARSYDTRAIFTL